MESRSHRAIALSALLLACAAAGCLPPVEGPGPAELERVHLQGRGADSYGESSPAGPLTRLVLEAARRSGPPLEGDGCLDRAAAVLGRYLGPECKVWPRWLQEPVLHHEGCVDGAVTAVVSCDWEERPGPFLERLARTLPDLPPASHVGTARVERGRGPHAWVVLLAERRLALLPYPRRIALGTTEPLVAALAPGLSSPRAYSMGPAGGVEEVPLREGSGPRSFVADFTPELPGEHWLEVMASGRDGPRIVALFPVYVDVDPPAAFDAPPPHPDEAATPEEAEAVLFELVNVERSSRGLPMVHYDPELARVARWWSEEMRLRGRLAHVGPDGQGPGDRAASVGYSARRLGEVLARGQGVGAAHEALMSSPAHRATILDPSFTHVGIGAAVSHEAGGRFLYVAEEFALPQRVLGPDEVVREVQAVLAAHRDRLALPRAGPDPVLAGAAARFVEEADPGLGEGAARALEGRIVSHLRARGRTGGVLISLQVVGDPEEYRVPDAFDRVGLDRIGVGAEVRSGPGATLQYVVLLLAGE
jgi:hypothetical protein